MRWQWSLLTRPSTEILGPHIRTVLGGPQEHLIPVWEQDELCGAVGCLPHLEGVLWVFGKGQTKGFSPCRFSYNSLAILQSFLGQLFVANSRALHFLKGFLLLPGTIQARMQRAEKIVPRFRWSGERLYFIYFHMVLFLFGCLWAGLGQLSKGKGESRSCPLLAVGQEDLGMSAYGGLGKEKTHTHS